MTALVEGGFGLLWLSWGPAQPPAALRIALLVASGAAVVVAVLGAIMGFRSPIAEAAAREGAALRRYVRIVAVEFGAAIVGGALLILLGQARFVPALVCVVVGLHFLPLAAVLRDRRLVPLGALMTAVGVIGAGCGLAGVVPPSTVTGPGAGTLLVVFGALALASPARARVPA